MFATPLLVIGILATAGGIYALRREKWGWAITGSIATLFLWMVLAIAAMVIETPPLLAAFAVLPGIAAVVFTAKSRGEFK